MMKRVLLVALTLVLLLSLAYADIKAAGPQKQGLPSSNGRRMPQTREVPEFSFSVAPTAVLTSFFDYMIGSYNSTPIRVIPDVAGGGYFMTYMGQRQASSQRRVFYTYINSNGQIVNNNEITNVVNREGFPSLGVDPVSGKPIYAWHANADADAELEVQYVTDAFLEGLAGLFNDVGVVHDNPVSLTTNGTTDNEFIWPSVVIGPSPIAGKRRVYIESPNAVNHSTAPVGNTRIGYADFDGDDIELGNPFVWSYTTIPELDAWDADDVEWRRTFNSLVADDAGNIYYVGTHFAAIGEEDIDEPDFDVHICDAYGAGTWRRVSHYSDLSSWNPLGYFEGDDGPFADNQLLWSISNSGHLNTMIDNNNNNKIRTAAMWALKNTEGTYWPAFHTVKEMVFDIGTETFVIKEIYPKSQNPNDFYQPWDTEAPWGEVDEVDDNGDPLFNLIWPFPHWDTTLAGGSMLFHYNHIKMSEVNDQDMLVVVWQDAMRARMYNLSNDPDYAQFANVPEIYLVASPDNGHTWSEPISINNVETPGFANIKPMWPYPADKVKFVGMQNGHKVGRIGMMFFDDYTWGSYSNTPADFPTNDGGRVMFAEIEIVFPIPNPGSEQNLVTPATQMLKQNYPNPFNPETNISFFLPNPGHTNLSIYNVKGQLIKTLVNGSMLHGSQNVVWNGVDNNGNNVTSGIYFYKLTHNGNSETRKMMLLK